MSDLLGWNFIIGYLNNNIFSESGPTLITSSEIIAFLGILEWKVFRTNTKQHMEEM